MRWRYAAFDPRAAAREQRLERLLELYQRLLLLADGDVERALEWLEQVGGRRGLLGPGLSIDDVRQALEQGGLAQRDRDGRLSPTRRGEAALRRSSLEAVFGTLARSVGGEHRTPHAGQGGERLPETRPWEFGDPLSSLAATETVANAVRRGGLEELTLAEEDLRVHESEHHASCASVLLIDVSHSMILYGEDRITPAKDVALALCELIRTRYPKDSLEVVVFGDEAWRVPLEQLPYLKVGPWHTNTRAGLQLARGLLRRAPQTNRRILMLTDGKPSALTEQDGTLFKNPFGLDRRIVNKTLEEAEACRRHGIPITTFMLTEDPLLVGFVEQFTRANKGQAFYSRPSSLGGFVLVDYLRNRRRRA